MQALFQSNKLVICLAGLPARGKVPFGREIGLKGLGKTYISLKLARYLNWIGYTANVFNIANFRKSKIGILPLQYFDPTNKEASEKRQNYANDCVEAIVDFLESGGDVAIYDGSNTTKERRLRVRDHLTARLKRVSIMWLEIICDDEQVIENNIRQAKISHPDFEQFNEEEATKQFKARLLSLTPYYEPLSELEYPDISFVKLINVGQELEIHNIDGYLESKILQYIMNLHIYPRPIYFTRHGETFYNLESRIGGDSELTPKGERYSRILGDFFRKETKTKEFQYAIEKPVVFCSTLKRGVSTASEIDVGVKPTSLKILEEIDCGLFEGWTFDEIKAKEPGEWAARCEDKLTYRFPRGESYLDLIQRIEPVIFEIERAKGPVIVICPQATLRCIYGYFAKDYQIPLIPSISMPHWMIIKLVPETYYCRETRLFVDAENGTITSKIEETESLLGRKKQFDLYK